MYVVKIVPMLFCLLILNVSNSGSIFHWRKLLVQLSASLSLVEDNSFGHELRIVAAVELHLNATYYAQHPALKSVHEKG